MASKILKTIHQKMFDQREDNPRYPSRKTLKWLHWLAQRMQVDAQTNFLIEQFQPNWFNTQGQKITYWLICKILNSCKILLLCLCFSAQYFLMPILLLSIIAKPSKPSLNSLILRMYDNSILQPIHEFLTLIYLPNPLITKEIFLLTSMILMSGFQVFLIIEFIYLVYLATEKPEEIVRPVEKYKFIT